MIIKLLGVTGVLSVFHWFTNTFPIKSLTNIHILGTETSIKNSQKISFINQLEALKKFDKPNLIF